MPVVLMNRLVEDYSIPSVSVDNERGVRMAVSHLAALGHRRIAHIAGPQDLSTGRNRYRGFVGAMAASGLPVDPSLVVFAGRFSIEEGHAVLPGAAGAAGAVHGHRGRQRHARPRLLRRAGRGRAELPAGYVGRRLQRHAVH